jgi:hypothetical protein
MSTFSHHAGPKSAASELRLAAMRLAIVLALSVAVVFVARLTMGPPLF